jgi:uncharacterized damage-inducible protein DinB
VAHALLQADEVVERTCATLSVDQIWDAPKGVASIGYHLLHLAGSTDRLFTYARNEPLTEAQKTALAEEKHRTQHPDARTLLNEVHRTIAAALEQLRATPEHTLHDPREVGRARLPSTVIGLLVHAAEHASRHTGQIVTTARILTSKD